VTATGDVCRCPYCPVLALMMQTKDQPELSVAAPEACRHLGTHLTGAAAVVLSQLLASYLPEIIDDTFLDGRQRGVQQ